MQLSIFKSKQIFSYCKIIRCYIKNGENRCDNLI